MAIKIGHSSIDERGKASGGSAGDQTGKEVVTRTWYNGNWHTVLRPKSIVIAEKSAQFVEDVCANKAVGYDQGGRNTLYKEAKKVDFNGSKIKTKCECDCSAFMHVAAIAGGANLTYGSNGLTTSTMKNAFKASGDYEVLTASKYLTSDKYLKRGDILIKNGHVVMALEHGSAFKAPLKIAQSKKEIQKFLNTYYGWEIVRVLGELLEIDGKFGTKSKKALAIAFQVELNKLGAGLKIDGSFGSATATAFKKFVEILKKGIKGSIFVTLWQCLLVGFGYDPKGIDSSFGSGCEDATNKLFKAKGITRDSNVSGADINVLL